MDINFLAVILAALSAFFLGFVWYNVAFAKPWQQELGVKDTSKQMMPPNLGQLLAGSFVLEVLMAIALASLIGTAADAMTGLRIGLVVGFVLVGFAFGVNYLFEGKTMRHWLINASYYTAVFGLMGLIIGVL